VEVQRTFALARQKLGEVLSAVEFCDRMAFDFVLLGGVLMGISMAILMGKDGKISRYS
jgi:hypothetical protein